MQILKASMEALKKLDNNSLLSVEELPAEVKWDLWENGLVKGKNTITNLGKTILKQILKKS